MAAKGGDEPKTYQLHIRVDHGLRVGVGRLGLFDFPAGRYVYTGSAKRHLQARINRHLRQDKTLRWHIDYLLTAPGVSVTAVQTTSDSECALNQATPGEDLVRGFGSSDCRHACGSHLKYLGPLD